MCPAFCVYKSRALGTNSDRQRFPELGGRIEPFSHPPRPPKVPTAVQGQTPTERPGSWFLRLAPHQPRHSPHRQGSALVRPNRQLGRRRARQADRRRPCEGILSALAQGSLMSMFKRPTPDEFREDQHSWRERNEIRMRRRRFWWRRHIDWIASFAWPARIVIVLGYIAVCYLTVVFGLWLGV